MNKYIEVYMGEEIWKNDKEYYVNGVDCNYYGKTLQEIKNNIKHDKETEVIYNYEHFMQNK